MCRQLLTSTKNTRSVYSLKDSASVVVWSKLACRDRVRVAAYLYLCRADSFYVRGLVLCVLYLEVSGCFTESQEEEAH